jgi:hypothetical protein
MVGRAAALLGILACLAVYYGVVGDLWQGSLWWDVVWLGLVLIPVVFVLVGLALPLWSARGLLPVGAALIVLAFVADHAGLDVLSNFSKLAGVTFLAWWFLSFFEDVSWVVLVALIIPWVDAYSVWRGPTKHIVEHRENVFSALSFSFPVPGGGAAQLGLPDILFYALFLGASVRFNLRPFWTWLGLTASFGVTMTLATWWDVSGLPALPLLSVGFLLPNADLLWRRLRRKPGLGDGADVPVGAPADDAGAVGGDDAVPPRAVDPLEPERQ